MLLLLLQEASNCGGLDWSVLFRKSLNSFQIDFNGSELTGNQKAVFIAQALWLRLYYHTPGGLTYPLVTIVFGGGGLALFAFLVIFITYWILYGLGDAAGTASVPVGSAGWNFNGPSFCCGGSGAWL